MPRYSYYCESCEAISDIFHSLDEVIEECPTCLNKEFLHKMVSKPFYNTVAKDITTEKPKEKVERHIETAREELEQQREELKNEDLIEK